MHPHSLCLATDVVVVSEAQQVNSELQVILNWESLKQGITQGGPLLAREFLHCQHSAFMER